MSRDDTNRTNAEGPNPRDTEGSDRTNDEAYGTNDKAHETNAEDNGTNDKAHGTNDKAHEINAEDNGTNDKKHGRTMNPTTEDGLRAIVAARDADTTPDTAEIRGLAAATGYTVVDEITQRRREDPTYGLGRGKAEDLMRLVAERDADAVVYDGQLSPGQTYSLGELLPPGTAVIDRPRLVMERFTDAAGSRAADLQLELARLRYELPRLREAIARDDSEEIRLRPEGDSRVLDVERRIESAERALDAVTDDRAERRARRREAGFDLIVVVGYTNAGKSRLCRRLADDIDGEEDEAEETRHEDLNSVLATGDRLFETLSTTTHEATMDGRRTLVTDTIGFVDDLPHDALRSFRATIEAAREADCVLLVADGSDERETLRRKLRTSLSTVAETAGPVIPVLNKTDRLDAAALEAVIDTVEAVVETAEVDVDEARRDDVAVVDSLRSPVPISARDGTGVADLREAVADALPTATETVQAPNGSHTESTLSWAYDRGIVEAAAYTSDGVTITLTGRPAVVAEATRRFERS